VRSVAWRNLAAEIASALDACELFVVLGTTGYGEQGDSRFSTREELEFVVSRRKPICLIKRCEAFADPLTQMYLPASMLHQVWDPLTDMPEDLVDNIKAKLAALLPIGSADQPTLTLAMAAAPFEERCVTNFHPRGSLADPPAYSCASLQLAGCQASKWARQPAAGS
jgi:hypothetical protein